MKKIVNLFLTILLISTFTYATDIYSLDKYQQKYPNGEKCIGDEYISILKDKSLLKSRYSYALKKAHVVKLNKKVRDISQLIYDKPSFKDILSNKIFKPFEYSNITRVIFNKDMALVSFGYYQDKDSVVFGDFLLKKSENLLFIYPLEVAVACGGNAVEPVTISKKNTTKY